MDADQAMPILRKVLARRDACSEPLRKKAVFLVAQKQGAESASTLLDVARSDPSADVRGNAIFWLGQVPGDRTVTLLDSVLRSTKDEDLQNKAIFALSQHESPRATQTLRDLVTRPGVSDDTRRRAIFAIGQSGDHSTSLPYLEQLFPTLQNDALKDQVLMSVAQSDAGNSRAWLSGVVRDPKERIDVRKKALFWLAQQEAVGEVVGLYDALPDEALKEQAIFALSQRQDKAATDKLIDIAQHDPNHELRKKAIFWLGQRDDPRVRTLLEQLIDNDAH
jgi:HEAT repeat protein